MAPKTPENRSDSSNLLPGSGTVDVAETGAVEDMRSDLHVSFLGVSEPEKGNGTGGAASIESASEAGRDSLPDADRQALFSGLQATLKKAENRDGISDKWNVIEQALMKNPSMMCNLKKLQDMGAELVVTDFCEGQYVEFADAALNLDIRKQEGALARLASAERDVAIEQILQPLDQVQREPAKQWILSQLTRQNARGLNWVEALVLAVAHGGTLISFEAYDAMARKDSSAYENVTWTWYLKNLSDVMRSGGAPGGYRRGGGAVRVGFDAVRRVDGRGGRVAGLRVEIA